MGVSPNGGPSGGTSCRSPAGLQAFRTASAIQHAPTVPANESLANLTKPEGAAVTSGTAAAAAAGGTISGTAGIRTSSIRLRGCRWSRCGAQERGREGAEGGLLVVVCHRREARGRVGGC